MNIKPGNYKYMQYLSCLFYNYINFVLIIILKSLFDTISYIYLIEPFILFLFYILRKRSGFILKIKLKKNFSLISH